MKKQLVYLLLLGLFGFLVLDNLVAQKNDEEYKNFMAYSLEYYFKLGLLDDTLCQNSAISALEITNRVKQFAKDYSSAANPAVLAAYFCADAEMVGPNGQKHQGAYAIGLEHANIFQQATCELSLDVEEVTEVAGDHAFSWTLYLNKVTTKKDPTLNEKRGVAISLWRKDGGQWKILRHLLMDKIE